MEEAKKRMKELGKMLPVAYLNEYSDLESKRILLKESELETVCRRNGLEFKMKKRDSIQDEIDDILNAPEFQSNAASKQKLYDVDMLTKVASQQSSAKEKMGKAFDKEAAVKSLTSAFAKNKPFEMQSNFVGAASRAIDGGDGEEGGVRRRGRGIAFMLKGGKNKRERAKTPTMSLRRMVTAPNSKEKHYTDSKQEYEKLIKGVEARFKKKNKLMVNLKTISKVIPRNPHHSLNVLNATARDEPIKHMAADMDAADLRYHSKQDVYAAHFTKFKPLFSHPLPTGRPRYDCEKLVKKLNNLPREERAAAAAFWGNAWCIEEIYMQDCPVNSINSTGFTPLHIAARFNYVDCVQCLLNIGELGLGREGGREEGRGSFIMKLTQH